MKTIELFAGAGGLALGMANAGFKHQAMLEWNSNACKTLRCNKADGVKQVKDCDIVEGDVRDYNFSQHFGKVAAIAGGPPCQPFSMGGKHRGQDDQRNMFPEAVRAVREIVPRAFVFENVKGLLRQNFSNYYNYIIRQLSFPDVIAIGDEDWISHNARLEKLETSGEHEGLCYNIVYKLVDAADFGVPQRRHRVFIVGVRSDLGIKFKFPFVTYSEDRLLYDQWVSGDKLLKNSSCQVKVKVIVGKRIRHRGKTHGRYFNTAPAERMHVSRSFERHEAGAVSKKFIAPTRIPLSVACRELAWAARSRVPLAKEGRFCTWLFLAPASVQTRKSNAEESSQFLAAET